MAACGGGADSDAPREPDTPLPPPPIDQRTAPNVGDVVLYIRTAELTDVFTLRGETSFFRRYQSFEVNLSTGSVGPLFATYSQWSNARTLSISPLTLDDRLFGFDGPGDTLVWEVDQRRIEPSSSLVVPAAANVGVVGAWGEHLYFVGLDQTWRARLLPIADGGASPLEPFDLGFVSEPSVIPCAGLVQDGPTLYCQDQVLDVNGVISVQITQVDLPSGAAETIRFPTPADAPGLGDLLAVVDGSYVFAHWPEFNDSAAPRRRIDFMSVSPDGPSRVLASTEVPYPEPDLVFAVEGNIRVRDASGALVLLENEVTERFEVWDLEGDLRVPSFSGDVQNWSVAEIARLR